MNFEEKLDELEKISEKLDDKNVGLEEGIALYEKGLATLKECLESLEESRGKIAVIKKEMDKLTEESFNED